MLTGNDVTSIFGTKLAAMQWNPIVSLPSAQSTRKRISRKWKSSLRGFGWVRDLCRRQRRLIYSRSVCLLTLPEAKCHHIPGLYVDISREVSLWFMRLLPVKEVV